VVTVWLRKNISNDSAGGCDVNGVISKNPQKADCMKPATWFDILTTSPPAQPRAITPDQYRTWQDQSVFDMLSGQRYGQSFCDRFDIQDNILYYYRDQAQADDYIKRHYLHQSD
jgi:hypothetical protein